MTNAELVAELLKWPSDKEVKLCVNGGIAYLQTISLWTDEFAKEISEFECETVDYILLEGGQ